jgi:hypothetical protein
VLAAAVAFAAVLAAAVALILVLGVAGGTSSAYADTSTGSRVASYSTTGCPAGTPTWRVLYRIWRSSSADSTGIATDSDLAGAESSAQDFAARVGSLSHCAVAVSITVSDMGAAPWTDSPQTPAGYDLAIERVPVSGSAQNTNYDGGPDGFTFTAPSDDAYGDSPGYPASGDLVGALLWSAATWNSSIAMPISDAFPSVSAYDASGEAWSWYGSLLTDSLVQGGKTVGVRADQWTATPTLSVISLGAGGLLAAIGNGYYAGGSATVTDVRNRRVVVSGPLATSHARPLTSPGYDPSSESVYALAAHPRLAPGVYRVCLSSPAGGRYLAAHPPCRTLSVWGNPAGLVRARVTRGGLVLHATGPLAGRGALVTFLYFGPPCSQSGPYTIGCGQPVWVLRRRVRLSTRTVIAAPGGWAGRRHAFVTITAARFTARGLPYGPLALNLPLR